MSDDRYVLPEWLIARLLAGYPHRGDEIHATFRACDPPPAPSTPLRDDLIASRCAELTLPPCRVVRRESRRST